MKARTQYLINVYVKLNSAGRKDQFRRGRYNDPRQSLCSGLNTFDEAGPLLGQVPSAEELHELEAEGYITINCSAAITATLKAKNSTTGGLGAIVP